MRDPLHIPTAIDELAKRLERDAADAATGLNPRWANRLSDIAEGVRLAAKLAHDLERTARDGA